MNIFDKKQEPDLASLLDTLKQSIIYNYNFHRIGVIEEFFTNNQTASVKLVDKKITLKSDGSKEVQEYPLLINCPVLINKNKL